MKRRSCRGDLVFWDTIRFVENWASTWTNQTSGSADQNGGNFTLTLTPAKVEGPVAAAVSSSDISLFESRRGHQNVATITTLMF